MIRVIEQRLRKLEADNRTGPVRMVWSDQSDPTEWDQKIAEMIASGQASQSDEFMRIGRALPSQKQSDEALVCPRRPLGRPRRWGGVVASKTQSRCEGHF